MAHIYSDLLPPSVRSADAIRDCPPNVQIHVDRSPARCGTSRMSITIAMMRTADASGRLNSSPPFVTGLSRKSPTVARSGRVRMSAAQNSATRLIVVCR